MKNTYLKARSDNKVYLANAGNLKLSPEDIVLFENENCQEVGTIIESTEEKTAEESEKGSEEVVVIRRLNEKDLKDDETQKNEAKSMLPKCREIIEKHNLPMELLDADLSFDGKKLTFYFTAPGRVDFRSLVSELAATFQKLIRLQQVGIRDRARCIGGIGRCGEQFCCQRFLKGGLDCVTTDMAYDQNLGQMGPNRVTGACGKLMCCLKYELDFYKERKKNLPAIGSEIKTPKGKGTVVSQNIIKNKVTVSLPDKVYLEVDWK